RNEPDTRGYLGYLLNPNELRVGPWTAMRNRLRRLPIVVLHVSGQDVTPWIETPRQAGAEHTVRLCWRVDCYLGIDLQEVIEPTRMVAMPMRDNGKIEVPQVDSHGRSVLCKGTGIIPSIEEKALAIECDQGRKAPLFSQPRRLSE